MESGDPFGMIAGACYGRHRKRGGVGRQNAIGCNDAFQLAQKLLLCLDPLDDGFYDQIALRKIVEAICNRQA